MSRIKYPADMRDNLVNPEILPMLIHGELVFDHVPVATPRPLPSAQYDAKHVSSG